MVEKWKTLTEKEKKPYYEMRQKDLIRYEQEMKEYEDSEDSSIINELPEDKNKTIVDVSRPNINIEEEFEDLLLCEICYIRPDESNRHCD